LRRWKRGDEQPPDKTRSRWVVDKGQQDVAMSTGCWRIKPYELERTLKSIRAVGLHIRSVDLTRDGIKITVTESETAEPASETPEQLRNLL
jgi:hypothetical protein